MQTITATPAEIGAMRRAIAAANQERQNMEPEAKPEKDPAKQTRAGLVYYLAQQLFPGQLAGLSQVPGSELDSVARKLKMLRRDPPANGSMHTAADDAAYIRKLAAFSAFEAAEAFQKEADRRNAGTA